MTQAILGGLIAEGQAARDCFVVEPHEAARVKLSALAVESAATVLPRVFDAEAIVLAVKPQMMREAIAPLVAKLQSQLVISIAAGIRSADLSRWLAYPNIVRTMPNTPALIHAGITGLYAMPAVSARSEEHTSELQSHSDLVCRLLLEKKKNRGNDSCPRLRRAFVGGCDLTVSRAN